MKHRNAFRKLGRASSHRWGLLRTMVSQLIQHERIETTVAKAKELRSVADRMVTLAKEGTLQSRREAAAVVRGKDVLQKLFYDLSERYKDRAGGYTRVLPTRTRVGDAAPMAYIEGHRKSIRLLHMDRPDELRRIRPLINSPQEKLSSRVLSLPVSLSLSASSHLPLSASSHLPLSASSHLPLSASSHLPLSASSHLPLSASSHLPLSASSHLPLSASSHLPLSVSSHLPLSVSSHLPLSVSSYACLHASAGTSINPMSFTAAAPLQSLHLPPSPRPPRYIDRPDDLRRSRPPSIPPPPSEPRPPGCSLPSEDTAFTPPPPPPPPPSPPPSSSHRLSVSLSRPCPTTRYIDRPDELRRSRPPSIPPPPSEPQAPWVLSSLRRHWAPPAASVPPTPDNASASASAAGEKSGHPA
ncbi:unnamed protein product [Closterium sp. NIES-65]|nr:unnamed protein product [Closterium sp. NIES-65]